MKVLSENGFLKEKNSTPFNFDRSIIATESQYIKSIISPLKPFRITDFIFMRFYPDNTFIDFATHMEYGKVFFDNFYSLKYKVEDLNQHVCFRDGVSLWIHNPQNIIWNEGKDFNVGNGISIFRQHPSYLSVYVFYGNVNDYKINNFYINHLDILENFINYFNERTSDIIQKAEKDRLILPYSYIKNNKPIDDIDDDAVKKLELKLKVKSDEFGNCYNFEPLTKRELECLEWICAGKSSEEIGLIFSCSKRTIESHIGNMKSKLNCTKVTQLVYQAAKLNLLTAA